MSPDEWKLGDFKFDVGPEPSLEIVQRPKPPSQPAPRVEVAPMDFYGGELVRRLALVDAMAAVYYKHTQLPPDEVELVEVREQGQTRWFFRKRA